MMSFTVIVGAVVGLVIGVALVTAKKDWEDEDR